MNSERKNIAIIGLGYVGLPLLLELCQSGFGVVGLDIDETKISKLNKGESYISYIPDELIGQYVQGGQFEATADFNLALRRRRKASRRNPGCKYNEVALTINRPEPFSLFVTAVILGEAFILLICLTASRQAMIYLCKTLINMFMKRAEAYEKQ